MSRWALRWQLYALAFVAFVFGVLRLRAAWVERGENNVRQQLAEDRLREMRRAQEIENEVEALDRDTLQRRAARWVRNHDPKH